MREIPWLLPCVPFIAYTSPEVNWHGSLEYGACRVCSPEIESRAGKMRDGIWMPDPKPALLPIVIQSYHVPSSELNVLHTSSTRR